ncbi:MAG: monovalent cation/H(+) antiporter subunit G [Oscillochloris sp.]|nr:monovalent cation/H(+) antiporter subunit G [Oscillochloris sp.]
MVRIWIAVGLTTLGLLVMTAAVYGMLWMPGLYTRLHAASKAAYLGILPIIVAVALLGDRDWYTRAVLIVAFILLTTTVSSHVIGKAAFDRGEPMGTNDTVDESGRGRW